MIVYWPGQGWFEVNGGIKPTLVGPVDPQTGKHTTAPVRCVRDRVTRKRLIDLDPFTDTVLYPFHDDADRSDPYRYVLVVEDA